MPTATPTLTPTAAPITFAAVSVGSHTCGLKTDGSLVCWDNTPSRSGSFTSVSVGAGHACGVKTDGSVICWGSDEYGKASPPDGSFDSVSAGYVHTCGLKADGSVTCWGSNEVGQSNNPSGTFVSVRAGYWHSCGVKSNGSIACWGYNGEGQAVPPGGSFASVSAGGNHSCGVKTNNSVTCWGSNDKGQATPPGGSFVSVSAAWDHTCGVKTDGSVVCWGSNEYGKATPPAGSYKSVSATAKYACGVKSGGSIVCWGLASFGQPPGSMESASGRLENYFQPPEHMANVWWHWPRGVGSTGDKLNEFRELVMDITIHSDPGDFSDDQGLYLMLCHSSISDVGFYFGLQTDVHDPERGGRGKGLIFSRWKTRDLANARVADPEEGWTQSSGHEGDFIGVRRPYDWGAGDYRVRFAPDGSDSEGEWFGLWITDKGSGETTWAGSLKFPFLNGTAAISSPTYSTIEIYGGPIRPIDIPEWHVSIERPSGDGVKPAWFGSQYSPFVGMVLNSNVRYDWADDEVHLRAGGSTERIDPEQSTSFD